MYLEGSVAVAQRNGDDGGGIKDVDHGGELLGGDRRLESSCQLANSGTGVTRCESREGEGRRHEAVKAADADLVDHRLRSFGVPSSDVGAVAMPFQSGP